MNFYRFLLLLTVLTVCCTSQIFAQDTDGPASMDRAYNMRNIIPPSPNAAALGKYGEWPVNLNTGVPNIDIPLYELKGRSLSVPISLSYHASGIKVGEVASWVGIGWSLQAGGVITRSVRGLPDECTSSGYFKNRRNLPDYNYTFNLTTSTIWTGMVEDQTINDADGVQDMYYLNALGRSYKLLFKDSVKGVSRPVIQTIPYSNVVIKASWDFSTTNTWTVILEDGTQLVFGGAGCTEVTTYPSMAKVCGRDFISSWYLQSITSPIGEKITFKYTPATSVAMATRVFQDDMIGWSVSSTTTNALPEPSMNSHIDTLKVTILQPDSIISDAGFVKFTTRSDSQRVDLPGTRALAGIAAYLRTKGHVKVDSFTFKTHQSSATRTFGYTINGADYMNWRLMLDAVEHNGVGVVNGNIPKWQFSYNSQHLPSTLSYAQDHYGYYNGATSNVSLLPKLHVSSPAGNTYGFFPPEHQGNDRTPDGTAMQASILTGITYPTGGSSQFTYEPNSYPAMQEQLADSLLDQTVLLDSSKNATADSITTTFVTTQPQYIHLSMASYISPGLSATNTVEVTGTGLGSSSIQLFASTKSNGTGNGDSNGSSSGTGGTNSGTGRGGSNGAGGGILRVASGSDGNGGGDKYYDLPTPGTYSFTVRSTIDSADVKDTGLSSTVEGSLRYTKSLGIKSTPVLVGGLRVSSIIDSDGANNSRNKERYFVYSNYKTFNEINPVDDYETELTEQGNNLTNTKIFRNSTTKFTLGSGGSTIAYGKVITKYGKNQQNGYVQTTFLNPWDVNSGSNTPPYLDVDTRDYERGLITSEITFDAGGNKIQATFNTYNITQISQLTFYKSFKKIYYQDPDICKALQNYCSYYPSPETLTSEQIMKATSRQVSYKKTTGGYDSLSTLTTYVYETTANTQPTKITVTDSRGVTWTTSHRTPFEKSAVHYSDTIASNAIDAMIKKNMVATILEQEQLSGSTLVNRVTTNYKTLYSGSIIVPNNVQVLTGGASTAEPRVQFNAYDSNGNLLEQQKTLDAIHSYIYDYKLSYPVAEAVNADASSIAYTSFEADGSGNWSITPSNYTVEITNAYTGSRSLSLANTSVVKTGLTTSVSYKVSFWAKGGTVLINNTAAPAIMTRKGWSFYEKVITGVTTITLTGSGNLDEVRLYPAAAQMTTYTYIPLVGVQSVTDVRNATTFYEYDGLQRLVTIRDDNGKILKTYRYHYRTNN